MSDPVLLLLTTGPRVYREYLLRSLATRYRVHLVSDRQPTWESAYVDDVTVGPLSAELVVEAGSRRPAAGVLTWNEFQTVNAAVAARALGLPGPSPEAALRCRDKAATRSALDALGVPQPRSEVVPDLTSALNVAEKLGFPVVLKPRAGVASEGVVLVSSAAELEEHFAVTSSQSGPEAPGALVEEFVVGPEISVDCVVRDGVVTPVFLARKMLGYAPFFEEVGHTVAGSDPLLGDPSLLSVLTSAHVALAYTNGWTHTELRCTEGGYRVIEVNGRMGGDLVPYLAMLASGVDPGLLAAALVCGEPLPGLVPASRVAGIRFFYPPFGPARLVSLEGPVTPLVEVGDVVSPPGKGNMEGRVAFGTAVADTVPECVAALDFLAESVETSWS